MQTIKTIQIKLVKDWQLFWLAGQIGNKFGLWEVTEAAPLSGGRWTGPYCINFHLDTISSMF